TGNGSFTLNQATAETAYLPAWGRLSAAYTNGLVRNDSVGSDNSLTHIGRVSGDLIAPRYNVGATYGVTRGTFDLAPPYWEHTVEGRGGHALTPTASVISTVAFTQHEENDGQDFRSGYARIGGLVALGPGGSLSVQGGPAVFAPRHAQRSIGPNIEGLWTQRFSTFGVSAG
ncbi:MAG TPA: hypothetical protein VEU07_14210, partial [Candidatus Acidoferrum sp.]|nr:hypothetical protein [Candidatus Acidoferrum sp.]